ncbi:MAG: MarC family protein [Bacteroidales bacterium]
MAFLAFITLVNPVQKLLVVSSLKNNYPSNQLKKIINRASFTALGILILFLFVGEFIFRNLFNIEIYAFQVTCGFVLFYNGFLGIQKGNLITIEQSSKIEDIIAVPIAVPMIAGPATITAVVTMPSIYGKYITLTAVIMAILINLIIMKSANKLAAIMTKYNILMPLVRIIGLIVAAIGCQMIFNGMTTFLSQHTNI